MAGIGEALIVVSKEILRISVSAAKTRNSLGAVKEENDHNYQIIGHTTAIDNKRS